MTNDSAEVALVFGATGRLGRVMLKQLDNLGIKCVIMTRTALSNYLETGELPQLPERCILVDASIDYADLRQHEADKHAFITDLAERCEIELIASFSSGVTDFDDALIINPFYREYKQVKQENLKFFKTLGSRLFYPKIYTLIGPNSYAIKTTGWVDVLEQASNADEVSIAHPNEPRSWVSEECIQRIFVAFLSGTQADYLEAPVCDTFRLADIVSFCETIRRRLVTIKPGKATAWLAVPYVAPHPSRIDASACTLHRALASLLDGHAAL